MGGREQVYVNDAFETNWIAPLGPNVDGFEKQLQDYLGTGHAAALSSGTAALHLALILAGIKEGDHVLCSSFTFSASANPIVYQGATPVFIDSEESSWNMDPELARQALLDLHKQGIVPKAIIMVHLYGMPAPMDPFLDLCREFSLVLIEDAAEALGSTWRGKAMGTFGDFGVLSFNGNKIITTGGGGMLVTDDSALAQQARFLATQARDAAPHYQHSVIGYNYRLSNISASIGLGQLQRLPGKVTRRRAHYKAYAEAFKDLPGVTMQPEAPWGQSTHWLTCLTIDPRLAGVTREQVRLALEAANIEARPVWKPMHLQPVFAEAERHGGKVSEILFDQGLCLPSGSAMSADERDRVIAVFRSQFA